MYPEELCEPMRRELTNSGFQELITKEDVDNLFSKKTKTILIFINSVCGCAAGSARPGVILSTKNLKKPDLFTTVFAGQDKEATNEVRRYLQPFPPSSPSIALIKNGEVVHFIERHEIEGNLKQVIAENLTDAYNKYC
tara:strand:- start:155 stop:568 length:414 start_codon:yes stop_codon:yes gene_type:complete